MLSEYMQPTAASEGAMPPSSGRPCTSGMELDSNTSAPQPANSISVIKLACKGVVCLRLLGEGSPSKVVEKLVLDVEQRRRPLLQYASPAVAFICPRTQHSVGACSGIRSSKLLEDLVLDVELRRPPALVASAAVRSVPRFINVCVIGSLCCRALLHPSSQACI